MTSQEEVVPSSSCVSQVLGSAWFVPVLLLIVTVVLANVFFGKKKLNLPPYPKGLPLLGTMLKTRGPYAHKILYDLSKKWGPIYALKTGLKYFVVVTDADIAYDALVKNSQVFSTRVQALSRLNYTGWRSVNSAMTGPYWRDIRKNMVTQVLSTSRVTTFVPFRELELNNLIDRLREQAAQNDNVVQVLSNCRHTVFAILTHVVFGRAFETSVIEELDAILRRLLELLAPQVVDFLPFLQTVFGWKKHKKECQKLLVHMTKIFSPFVEEHRKLRDSGKPAGDYLDSLLVLQKQINLSETDLLALSAEVLTGGTDTTADTMEWAMGNLIQHQDIQARLYEEIKSVVPDGRPIGEEDVEKMPYLQAVVKETMRKHPPLPFGITHGLTEQTKLSGYDIPEDGMMLFMIMAFQNDPKRWDHPEIFNPDRFLSATPNPNHDMTGSHGPRSLDYIPFGAGRRICPAMNLALKHMHLIIGRMIQTFEWTTVNPGEDVDFSDHLQFTVLMKNRLYSRIKERSPQ